MKLDAGHILVGVALLSALGLAGSSVWRTSNSPKTSAVAASVSELIGKDPVFDGNPNSPLTLVVFMDYQCGPCRRLHGQIQDLLREDPKRMRVVYRNLPLSKIHPYAAEAALAALAVRDQGKYLPMHATLIDSDFTSKTVSTLLTKFQIDKKRFDRAMPAARERLLEDQALAKKCGIEYTPSVVVCKGDKAVRLGNPEDFYAYVP